MTSAVDLCSNALVQLGADPINSLTDGGGDRAILASNVYPMVRDAVLRAHPWNCCVKRVILSPDATKPVFGYNHRFTRPGDWLRTLSVGDDCHRPDFANEGSFILCNDTVFKLRYVARNDNPATWDSLLVDLVTLALKAKFAYPITKSTSLAQAIQQEYLQALKVAKSVDGQEDPPETLGEEFNNVTASRF